jgi:hypothetical protein
MQGQDESRQSRQSSVAGGWPAAGGWDIHMHPLSSASGAGCDDSRQQQSASKPATGGASAVSHMHRRAAQHGEMRAPGVQGMDGSGGGEPMGVARPFSHPVWPSGFMAAAAHWAIGSGHPGWRHLLAQMRVSWTSRVECRVLSAGCWVLG